MSLESLVDEIRTRAEAELGSIAEQRTAALARIASERDARLAELRSNAAKATEAEAGRERSQRIAAAHLAARRMLYEAREERLDRGLEETRALFVALGDEPRYATILRAMIASAGSRLGRSARMSGRREDAALLARLAGKAFDPTPRTIVGGLIAESEDGHRRLDLSFDELLRQRADAVRGLLA
ncbi:MAG TPA: V-type ATP synthase subunit E family protein [Thermoplasmata archaeon]|nr:V-type ATP synthase subunit E family protein [Thermoplasmata archaeon]